MPENQGWRTVGPTAARVAPVKARTPERSRRGRSPGLFSRAVLLFLVLFSVLLFSACGGAQFDGTEYRDKNVAFRVGPVPSGARQVDASESLLAFQNDAAGSTMAVSARCGVDSDDVPLRALVGHLFLQLTDREIVSEEEFTLDGRAALITEMSAHLDGVRRHFVVIVLKKDGCVYDFIHIDGGGDRPVLQDSREDFQRMVRGFRTL